MSRSERMPSRLVPVSETTSAPIRSVRRRWSASSSEASGAMVLTLRPLLAKMYSTFMRLPSLSYSPSSCTASPPRHDADAPDPRPSTRHADHLEPDRAQLLCTLADGTAARLGVRHREGYSQARFPVEVEPTWP